MSASAVTAKRTTAFKPSAEALASRRPLTSAHPLTNASRLPISRAVLPSPPRCCRGQAIARSSLMVKTRASSVLVAERVTYANWPPGLWVFGRLTPVGPLPLARPGVPGVLEEIPPAFRYRLSVAVSGGTAGLPRSKSRLSERGSTWRSSCSSLAAWRSASEATGCAEIGDSS
jgi:hypothetical protein